MTAHRNDTAPFPGAGAPALAGGVHGADALAKLTSVVLDALAEGAQARGGPLPAGGPEEVARRLRRALAAGTDAPDPAGAVLPPHGTGPEEALRTVVRAVAEGAADPADPWCAAHLHCPPLAVAAAADLAAAALNPSMDSWDQAPAATALEQEVTRALAALVHPGRAAPDALVTSGGTESNLVALLLARERARAAGAPGPRVVCGTNAHHSVRPATWVLGLADPVTVPCRDGRLDADALPAVLAAADGPTLVVATAGTTDEGLIDPLPAIAAAARRHGAELHVDAAYGGPLLFSERLAPRLDGLADAVSVTFDLHKLGWQPVAAGLLTVPDTALLAPLALRADYLNADDDTEAGLPDLLGRSLRTTRRPDVLKIAATLRALGRSGLGALVEHCVAAAEEFAERVDAHPALRRRPGPIGISTVLFRPVAADTLPPDEGDALVAEVRRRLLATGGAVVGRAVAAGTDGRGRLWLKATLLHPAASGADLAGLLDLVAGTAEAAAAGPAPRTAHHPPEGTP
ncbi:aspartate aminotransferase family protein [Streptomyces sp. CC53]|uniref:pyridoxal phosphate-dependent decarboxylase family protein n=1 Tax=unclassified Streptomyces TaxID=2593676 RepID=UPI0008DC7884|nr:MULTISPECIES: aminotransferase class V-fold PLP-dependent enzyme [unclassified Streptomyces]OII64573.1 aspartate aminotransferase family protein [Streptomyces sp. CC53]